MAGNESLLELRPGAQRNPIGPGGLGVAVEIVAGGGGGGDASAANQVLALTALDSIYDALQLVGTEATSADILAAVNSLAGGSTLGDLATALAPLATEATQADVLAALQAQGVDIASVQANVALLVPDLDAVRVAVESTDAKTPALGQALDTGSVPVVLTAAQLATLTPLSTVAISGSVAVTGPLTDAQLRATRVPVDGSGVTQPISGTVGADLRVANAAVTAANPVHVLAGSINWTAVGAIASAQNATIKASAGRLHSLRVEHASTGTQYLQLHDAASTGTIAAGTIRGLGYELVGSGDELVIEFDPPLSFTTGISWALSTTKNTYTAAAGKAAFVEARWE
jgi:hypothetical protein